MSIRLPRASAVLPWLLLFVVHCSPAEPEQALPYKLLQCGGVQVGAIRQGPVCELPQQPKWVDQRIVRVDIPDVTDDLKIEGGYRDSNDGSIWQIRVKRDSRKLVFQYPREGPARRIAVIPIAPYEVSRALEQGIDFWMAGNRPQAEKHLRQATTEGTPTMQARARRQLAKFLLEEDGEAPQRLREALALFEQAAQLSRTSGEISDEAYTILNQATLRQQYFRQSALAEQLLDSPRVQELSGQLPGLEPWIGLYRGVVFASADPYRALVAVEKGIVSADSYKDDRAGEQLCRQRSLLLHTLGRVAKAQESCEGRTVNPCWDAHNQLAQARIQLMNMEVTHQKGADPRPQLDNVIKLLQSDCPGSNAKQSEAQIYLAHAKLLAGDSDQLSDEQMAAWPKPQDPELYAELLAVRGELALINNQPGNQPSNQPSSPPAAAEKIFQTLLQLAQEKGLHAYAWRALIGLARSYELDDPPKALGFYQEALRLLEEWAEQLPLGLGHGSFVGRYEEGTRRYVDFLFRQKDFTLALEVVRRVRVLGLLALILTRQVEDLPEDKRTALLNARIDFEQARLSGNLSTQAQMRSKLFEQLSEILGQPRLFPLPAAPPLAPGEALFTCFPVFPEDRSDAPDSDWVCFATRDAAGAPVAVRVGPLDPERMTRPQLAQKLLKPFLGVLAPAKVIRVLEYGSFAQVPMHLLPLPDAHARGERHPARLGDQHSVVYALDLPAALLRPVDATLRSPSASSFLIIDPHKEHAELSRCAEQVRQAVETLEGPPRMFQVGMTLPALLEELNRVSFFHFSGHVTTDPGGYTNGLSLSATESISANMLLRLHHAPTRAVLIGCGTGSTQDVYGDGVTLGLAQALLVRGAREVIGTSRTVLTKTAALVECQLYRHFSGKDKTYPYAAALQRTLQETTIEAMGPIEQGAFRSYVY